MPSSPSLCPSGTHWRSAGCRGAEANLSPATAAAPCPQAPPSPPTSPALSNAAPVTSSAPGRPVAPLATPPTSWCCGESGATSPWQPRAAHWDTGIFGDVPWVPPPPPCARRGRAFFPPAMPHHGRARGTRRVPPRPTPCRGTASTSSPTPRPGWRRGGDPTCTAAPTSPCTSTRPVSAARPGWARRHGAGHRNHAVPAVKLDPPPDGMNFAKAKGLLQLRVPRPPLRGRERALSREARFRGVGNHSWTQVKCWWRGAGGGLQGCEQPWMQRGGSGAPSPPGWVPALHRHPGDGIALPPVTGSGRDWRGLCRKNPGLE